MAVEGLSIDNDHEAGERRELRQGGFTLWVKVDAKPGVEAMERFSRTYTEAPRLLCHVLRKLLSDDRQADLR